MVYSALPSDVDVMLMSSLYHVTELYRVSETAGYCNQFRSIIIGMLSENSPNPHYLNPHKLWLNESLAEL